MNALEYIHDELLHFVHSGMISEHDPKGRILIFADLGLGDICFMLPVIRALRDRPHTVICNNEEYAKLIRLAGACNVQSSRERLLDFGTVICNFQSQWTPIIETILSIEVPTRIGHIWREKYSWLWNRPLAFDPSCHWRDMNCDLLHPFKIEPDFSKLTVPNPIHAADILIAPKCSGALPGRDWGGYTSLLRFIPANYSVRCLNEKIPMDELLRTVSGSRLVIGNDSGLPKLAEALGVPSIQIYLSTAQTKPEQTGVSNGWNLVDPGGEDVLKIIDKILR